MLEFTVYDDGVIFVSLVAMDKGKADRNLWHLAIQWLEPEVFRDNTGKTVQTNNIMDGETKLFKLPHSFGVAVAKRLVEQKVAGLAGFHEKGFAKMVEWLVEKNELLDAMCY